MSINLVTSSSVPNYNLLSHTHNKSLFRSRDDPDMIGSSGHKWGVESQPSGRDTPLEGRCWNYPWYKSVGSILNVACTSEILTVDGWGQNLPWLCKTFWSAAYDTSCRTENKHIFYFIPTILKSTCLNVKTSNNIYRLILFLTSFCILIQFNESDHFTKGDIE